MCGLVWVDTRGAVQGLCGKRWETRSASKSYEFPYKKQHFRANTIPRYHFSVLNSVYGHMRVHIGRYWLTWARMRPCGPMRTHMGPYGPLWTQYGPIWHPHGPMQACMSPYAPVWVQTESIWGCMGPTRGLWIKSKSSNANSFARHYRIL